MQIILLGAGRMAHSIVHDLAADFDLTVADIDTGHLHQLGAQYKVATREADLSDPAMIHQLVQDYDIVVGAIPGALGYGMVKAVIEAGKPLVDISFCPEDILDLDALAKKHKVPAIVDMGVAPGMSNLFLGHHYFSGMQVDRFVCYVGGLPVERKWPFAYKAPFSPVDVIEEYTRPARIKRYGKVVTLPALSEPERLHFNGIGALEAFNTDGLRTLLFTMDVSEMIEKTLRYPGHAALMEVLRETGFFDTKPLQIGHQNISPLEVTERLLLKEWELDDEEPEFTVMRVAVEGVERGKHLRYEYDMLDYRDEKTGLSSMARTTGFACTAAVRWLAEGHVNTHGILPGELLAKDEKCLPYVLKHLRERGVIWHQRTITPA